VHAGAEDHRGRGAIAEALLPRAVRYAVERRRLRRELATVDEITGLPNLRGFVAIAEHQLRIADRAGAPVVLLFVRFAEPGGEPPADTTAREGGAVVLGAVRERARPG